MTNGITIDDEFRERSMDHIDDALDCRSSHAVHEGIGPAQGVRRDNHVLHGEERIAVIGRFLLDDIESRSRNRS